MADPRFFPTSLDKLLSHLIEECGEVVKEVGKIQRFGIDNYNPNLPEKDRLTNGEALASELLDLEGAITRLKKHKEMKGYFK